MVNSQRQIKFRAWDKENKEWIFNDVFISIPNGIIFEGKTHQEDIVDIQMFTGLKDKNGKEIYEGDIIWAGVFSEKTGEKLSGVVSWDEQNRLRSAHKWYMGGYTITKIKNSIIDFDNESKWEIIGNIYEDPELIPSNNN